MLQALQNVADALTALGNDALALKAEEDALNAAKAGLALIQQQYDDGAADAEVLLMSEQAYQQARIAHIHAVASRYLDTVTLFQALGGGWWNRRDPGALPADAMSLRSPGTTKPHVSTDCVSTGQRRPGLAARPAGGG